MSRNSAVAVAGFDVSFCDFPEFSRFYGKIRRQTVLARTAATTTHSTQNDKTILLGGHLAAPLRQWRVGWHAKEFLEDALRGNQRDNGSGG